MSENNKNNENKISPYDKLVIDIRNNLTTRLADLMSLDAWHLPTSSAV